MKPVVNLVLLGKGNVGSAWLSLFLPLKQLNKSAVELRLVAVSNSTRYVINESGLDTDEIDNFQQVSKVAELNQLTEELQNLALNNLVVLDLTASKKVSDAYLEFAQLGWHIVSANKLPLTYSTERYNHLTQVMKANHCFWGINATVGAALPVQASLMELLQAGDVLQAIEGVFSGSLSYLLTKYDGKESFTDLVKDACDKGFTEPDPREDLSGADVQRKLLILSRLSGLQLNLSDIKVKPLLPEALLQGSVQDFWQNKAAIDDYMATTFTNAQAEGQKLAYVASATVHNKIIEGSVGLAAKPIQSAVVQLTPTDNVFTLTTEFYRDNPLIIRGPGAGAIITATAVNIDINKFVTQLAVVAER